MVKQGLKDTHMYSLGEWASENAVELVATPCHTQQDMSQFLNTTSSESTQKIKLNLLF